MAMKGNKNSTKDISFWKESTKPVPGRPSLEGGLKCSIQNRSTFADSNLKPYKEFQKSVSDVWDLKYDEFYKVFAHKNPKQDFFLVHSTGIKNKISFPCKNISAEKSNIEIKLLNENSQSDCLDVLKNLSEHNSDETLLAESYEGDRKGNGPTMTKVNKLQELLESSLLHLDELRHQSWSGIPEKMRPMVWKLLAGYLPTSLERRKLVLERKRSEYWSLVKRYFDSPRDEGQEETFRQIHIDIPRMSPLLAIFNQKTVQQIFERILFIWAVRHPACGYVQGMNDLVTPFFIVFLCELLPVNSDFNSVEVNVLPKEHLDAVEADSFWCVAKFLDGIQDNYIFAQLGIQQKVNQLQELVHRVDKELHLHLEKHGIDYIQFSFRWINNLLVREIPLNSCIRLWDTYLSEVDNLAMFLLYVSAAFLLHWRQKLLSETDFQGLIMMLQKLPTEKWVDSDIGMIVAEAYRLKYTFADAPNHLQAAKSNES